ncbi:MAG: hypothetical protein LBP22_13240 [Deltaproteobacteria bacterium]|jgi:hypothetical protein|nr:hypothetical protein [Deltaproteobacteria bacterium]
MRIIIALVLGLGLLFSSVSASAETQVKFSGFYKVFHENDVNFLRAANSSYRDSESFFWHRLQLTVDFIANEDVTVRWVTRGPNTVRWGSVPYGDARGAGSLDLFTRAIYAAVNTDYGQFVIGRHNGSMVGNIAGLETLGYKQKFGDFLNLHVFDWALPHDGLSYSKKWENGFGLNVVMVKERSTASLTEKDTDADRFGIEPYFLWETGGAGVEVSYIRDKTPQKAYTTPPPDPAYTYPVDKNWTIAINPSFFQSWGNFAIHFEGKLAWGETVYRRRADGAPELSDNKVKNQGLGFYLDGVYNYGPGQITVGGWYFDGNSPQEGGGPRPGREKGHDLVWAGNFAPFLVAYGASIGLGAGGAVNVLGDGKRTSPSKYTVGNHWAIGILGDHDVTKDIRLHYGLGFFRAVNPWGRHLARIVNGRRILADNSKDLGYEIDLGVAVKLLNNLTWESHLGYFVNGDAYNTFDDNVPGSGQKAKDTYAWANALIFTF